MFSFLVQLARTVGPPRRKALPKQIHAKRPRSSEYGTLVMIFERQNARHRGSPRVSETTPGNNVGRFREEGRGDRADGPGRIVANVRSASRLEVSRPGKG